MPTLTAILSTDPASQSRQSSYWVVEAGNCVKHGSGGKIKIAAADIEDLKKRIAAGEGGDWQKGGQNFSHQQFDFPIGAYVPRMYRPIVDVDVGRQPPYEKNTAIEFSRQIRIIWERLQEIFESLYPAPANTDSYGDKIRHVLLLSAMEAEAQMKAILTASERPADNIAHYRHLETPMRLSSYEVEIVEASQLGRRRPFANFAHQKPTWWWSYNAVKHDREQNLHLATLGNAVDAYCALCVLYRAQYGHLGNPIAGDHIAETLFKAAQVFQSPEAKFKDYESYSNVPNGQWAPATL